MHNPTPTLRSNGRGNGAQTSKTKRPAASILHDLEKEVQELRGTLEAIHKARAVIEFELNGTILSANDHFLNTVGYRLDEIEGQHDSLFVDPASPPSDGYRQFWRNLNDGKPQTLEGKRLGKGGKELWLQATYTPILDPHGKPFKVLAVVTDGTEQHKLAEEIAELRVRAEITNLTSIISEADLKGDILSINEKFIEVSKYSREELIGKPHNTTRHPDMPKETFKELWATIGRGKTFRGVIKNRAKDGTPYYVDAVIAPVLGSNGKPRKYIGVRYDITAAELERQNMKGVLDAINQACAYIEFDTKGHILDANENFLQVLGYAKEEVLGKHHRMFVEPATASSAAYSQFWSDLAAGKSYKDVCKRIAKDGHEVWIQAVYAPVKDEVGRVVKVVKVAFDVTDRKEAELQLVKTFQAITQNAQALGSASEELAANS